MLITRDKLIIDKFKNDPNITYEELGNLFFITRERVRQILAKNIPEVVREREAVREQKARDTVFKEQVLKDRRLARAQRKCLSCGVKEVVVRGRCQSCYQKWRYHNLPGMKDKNWQHSLAWRKNNPEAWGKIQKRAKKKYNDGRRNSNKTMPVVQGE